MTSSKNQGAKPANRHLLKSPCSSDCFGGSYPIVSTKACKFVVRIRLAGMTDNLTVVD